jgi:hypothetical protein
MEMYIDLLKVWPKKSLKRIVFGCVVCAIGISRLFALEVNSFWNWLGVILPILFGVLLISDGLGYALERFFGQKSYLLINNELISMKLGVFYRTKTVRWCEIKSINYSDEVYTIVRNNGTTMKFYAYLIGKPSIYDVEKMISDQIKERNIEENLNN